MLTFYNKNNNKPTFNVRIEASGKGLAGHSIVKNSDPHLYTVFSLVFQYYTDQKLTYDELWIAVRDKW